MEIVYMLGDLGIKIGATLMWILLGAAFGYGLWSAVQFIAKVIYWSIPCLILMWYILRGSDENLREKSWWIW